MLILYINIDAFINLLLTCHSRQSRLAKRSMKRQILQLNPILIPEVNQHLATTYTVHKLFEISHKEEWLAANGANIEAVITGGHTGISRQMLAQLPALKVVAINGVGTDAVDLAAMPVSSMICPAALARPATLPPPM